jgi:hypothetical protein
MIRKTHPNGIPNGSLGILISAIELVVEHVPVNARDILTANWMSHNFRPVKAKQVTQDMVNRSMVFCSSFKGGIELAPASI